MKERELESTRIFMEEHEELFAARAYRLASICKKNDFEGNCILYKLKPNKLSFLYDGIGPEWEWKTVAGIHKHIKDLFDPAAFLHDVMYKACIDRSETNFHLVNRQFYNNCVKCAKMKYGWYNLKRYLAIRSAAILYEACENEGYACWRKYNLKIEFKR